VPRPQKQFELPQQYGVVQRFSAHFIDRVSGEGIPSVRPNENRQSNGRTRPIAALCPLTRTAVTTLAHLIPL